MNIWIQTLVSIICAVLASSGLWALLLKRADKKDAKSDMLMGLAHDRIMYLGMSYLDRDPAYITKSEYDNLRTYLYEPYERLGGNGSAKRIMQEVDKLPLHADDWKEE